jgi:ketosteroid isomerase-like protein
MEANKRLAAELFARISAGDVEGALATLADDASWWIAGKPEMQPAAGEHDKAWVARLFGRMGGALQAPMPMTVKGMIAEGDKVAVEVVGDGRLRDGRRYQNEYHFLLTVRDGKIAAVREYLDTQHVVATWFAPPPAREPLAPATS